MNINITCKGCFNKFNDYLLKRNVGFALTLYNISKSIVMDDKLDINKSPCKFEAFFKICHNAIINSAFLQVLICEKQQKYIHAPD